jgi:hypothetical protein
MVLNLTSLDLYGNQIGTDGAVELAQSTTLENLTSLHLSANRIGDAGGCGTGSIPELLTI